MPPTVEGPPQHRAEATALPARKRGEYTRWQLGTITPSPPPPAVHPPLGAPQPDPLQLAFEQAQQEGFAQGLHLGQETAENHYKKRLDDIERSLDEIAGLRSVLGEIYRRELVEVALSAAEALVQRELKQSSEVLESMLAQAMSALSTDDTFVLMASAIDAPRLAAWVESMASRVTLRVDAKRSAGDFRLEGAAGSVESLMHERIDRVRQLVLGDLAAEASG